MNLGNTIVQIREVAEGLNVGDNPAEESWFVASYRYGSYVLPADRLLTGVQYHGRRLRAGHGKTR